MTDWQANFHGSQVIRLSCKICFKILCVSFFVRTSALTFTEGIFLGRLIRSLEDRHSMVTGCLI